MCFDEVSSVVTLRENSTTEMFYPYCINTSVSFSLISRINYFILQVVKLTDSNLLKTTRIIKCLQPFRSCHRQDFDIKLDPKNLFSENEERKNQGLEKRRQIDHTVSRL